jgi:AraC-like DNA-binding protein
MAIPHASSELRGLLGGLARLGYDMDSLLASAGLRREDVEDPDAEIPARACAAVFARAQRERRAPNLALRLAMETPIGANPLLDYLIVTAESVGKGVERLCRYLRVVNPSVGLRFRDGEDPIRVSVEEPADPFTVELTISLSVLRFRRETEGRLPVVAISFRHQPDDVAEFERALGCSVHAKASWSGWALAREGLGLPLRRRDPILGRWLERQATNVLGRLPPSTDLVQEVRRLLVSDASGRGVTIAAAARKLAITTRTLQRRLAQSGTSYEALRDGARKEQAEAYLMDGRLSVAEVAYLLGYSEPSAFHRAFKRWYDTTPEAFRSP